MYAVLFEYGPVARDDIHAVEVDDRGGNDEHVEYLVALKLS